MKKIIQRFLAFILTLTTMFILVQPVFAASNPVSITMQPQSVSVANGKTAKVTFKASGSGLKYKWYYKNKGASAFVPTSTFSGNTYTAVMNSDRNSRQIYCVVTDKNGKSVKTNTVTLNMKGAVSITAQPKSVTVANGKTAKVTFKASGSGLKYKWYYKDKNASAFVRTSTFSGNAYTAVVNAKRNGRQIYCVVTDKYGNSVKSKIVTLNMKGAVSITTQPKSVTVVNGKTAKVTFKASGSGLKYTWYYKNKGASTFVPTSTFSGNTYTAVLNASRNGRQIYCVVTDKCGNSVKTNTVTLQMLSTLKITQQPSTAFAAKGAAAKIKVKASGDGLKYTWYFKNADTSSFSKTTTFTGSTYQVTMNNSRNGRQVYCVITDKYGSSIKTNTVELLLKLPQPTITCQNCLNKDDGATFDYSSVYTQKKHFDSMPLTFETVFKLNKNDLTNRKMNKLDIYTKYTETVLFSSDDTYEKTIYVSVTKNGNPKLGIRNERLYRESYNFVFDKVNVFSSKAVHMAITFDRSDKTVKCYIDGQLKQTIANVPKAALTTFIPTLKSAVGGDLYNGNPNHFPGTLYSLSVWSDVRSASEVNFDCQYGIDTTDSALMAYYDFTLCDACIKKDLSKKGNDLVCEKLWLDKNEVSDPGEYDFSFAVVGDTQELSEDDPSKFTMYYEWLVNNKDNHKIEYVLGLGDITQFSKAHEWEHARNQIYKLNGVIPYLLSRGNHDWDTTQNGQIVSGFNKTFNDGIYNQQITGSIAPGDLRNAYRTINICGIDYLFLTLDFGPNAQMLAWADSVISAHPNHRVIIITHGYMYHDGTTMDKDDAWSATIGPISDRNDEQAEKPSLNGDEMWEQLVSKHANIQLVISGHDPSQHVIYRQDKGENGNTVTQMLVDPQSIDEYYGLTGMVAMFYFSDNGNRLTVRYYSIIKDMYGSESSQFTIDLS